MLKISLVCRLYSVLPILLYILIICPKTSIDAFQPGILRPTVVTPKSFASSRKSLRHASLTDIINDDTSTEDHHHAGSATLQFVAMKSCTSSPMPLPGPGRTLFDFFGQEENIEMILAGPNNDVERVESVTPQLINGWKRECSYMNSLEPSVNGDEKYEMLFRVSSEGAKFPGLTIKPTVISGAKLLTPPHVEYPEYQYTLIKDYLVPEGSRILVWIHNQLTGAHKKNKGEDGEEDDDDKEQMTHSLLRVSAEPASDINNHVVFSASARLEVNVKFPSFLLRILPVSQEKANEQGSQSIQAALEKDVEPTFDMFCDAYLRWLLME